MSVCIGLCVYKNEFGLPYIFKNIERIQTLFPEKKIQIIVAFDESPDCSLGFLLSKLDIFHIHIMKNIKQKSNLRVENISNSRNLILDYIRENISETEYLIMMDTNDYACVGQIQLDVLKEVFEPEREKEWDSISFDCEDSDPLELINGFAIYKWSVFQDCNYNEQRNFHLQAIHIKNARICIYPKSLFAERNL